MSNNLSLRSHSLGKLTCLQTICLFREDTLAFISVMGFLIKKYRKWYLKFFQSEIVILKMIFFDRNTMPAVCAISILVMGFITVGVTEQVLQIFEKKNHIVRIY